MIQMRDGAPSAEDDAPSCPESEASQSYVTIRNGDALDELRKIPDASIDAIVTDPPYELSFMGRKWDSTGIAYNVELWREALRILRPGGHLVAFGGTRTYHRMACAVEDAGFEIRDSLGSACLAWVHGQGFPKGKTQLKPAWEPIVLARKPLSGTVAVTVLAHGTGALNIDGTRVGTTVETWPKSRSYGTKAKKFNTQAEQEAGTQATGDVPAGRWPANVLLSHGPDCGDVCTPGCPAAELDAQSGITPSNGRPKRAANQRTRDGGNGETHGAMAGVPGGSHDDTGGASRFFPVFRYQAKAPAKERPKVDGVAHPTVKPLELMRWLVRLVTPPGGTVLDPFAGSGTTLQAAREEGFTSIGIEREPTYLPLIAVRLGIEIEQPAPEPVVEVLDVQVTADDIEHDKALADLQGVDYVPWPGEPVVEVDPILKAIGDAPDRAALVALWRAHGDTWTPAYDEAARDRLTAIKTGGAVA